MNKELNKLIKKYNLQKETDEIGMGVYSYNYLKNTYEEIKEEIFELNKKGSNIRIGLVARFFEGEELE